MQKTTFDDFEIIRTLGQGAFSTVFLVKRKKDNKQYALKSIKMENLSKIEQQNSVNEVRILSSIVHPNIISYKESFWNWNNKTLNIIMEYCDDGDLESKIKKMERNKIKFNENLIWNYAFQILFGIKALHDKGVIHRDLKSANIFLSKLNNKCKIGDLNTGKVIKNNKIKNNSSFQIGTPTYFPPEIWKQGEISYKSDIWAFGCIVYEMCSLKMPFKGKNMEELKKNICKGKFEKISSRYSKELWVFIQTLLKIDLEKRPDCDMILKSKIVKDKLNQLSGFNFMNEINDDESSINDTIEYKNLWDLENKIPNKKKYTKTKISSNVEETIKNDSSFSEISSLDLEQINNKEQKSIIKTLLI
jgi:NIMA (never in mitosis gene a)-related kinase